MIAAPILSVPVAIGTLAAGTALASRISCLFSRLLGGACVAVAFLSLSAPAHAATDQNLVAADGAQVTCTASAKDLTRISLVGDEFAAVSKIKTGNPSDDFSVVSEAVRGDIYLSVPDGFNRATLSFFGTSKRGYVYKFLCRMAGNDAVQVFVTNPAIAKADPRLFLRRAVLPHKDGRMCNRYRMTARQADLAATFGIRASYEPDESYPSGDIFPTGAKTPFYGPVIRQDGPDRRVERMEWGLPVQLPSKRDPSVKQTKYVTNVRNLTSSAWRSMLTTPARRCLVPVTAFSEYGQVPGEDKRKPLHWFDVPSRPIFAFAGIWRPTDRGNAYGFLTTDANAIVEPIHPKAMPVILHDDDYNRWLSGSWDELKEFAAPYPSQLMRVA